MNVEITDITPAMAQDLLKANTRNRNLNAKVVAAYARAMSRGDWMPNGEAVKVATDGTLLDGQQRLAAVVRSGVTLSDMLLVTGLPRESQDTMDSGRKRTTADSLKISGLGNANVLASVTRRAWMWDRGNFKFTATESPTTAEIKETLERYPTLVRSAEIGTRTNGAFRPANATAVGMAHHLFHQKEEGTAAEFFAKLSTGARLDTGDPIMTLRDRLIREHSSQYVLTATLSLAFHIRAWNAMREDRKLAVIQHTAAEPMVMPI